MKDIVRKSYEFSKKRHEGQKSINGKDYFTHPEKAYKILLKKGSDDAVLCSALLHDLVEDTSTSLEEIEKGFGKEVAFLVDGMTKVKGLGNYLKKFEDYAKKDKRLLLVKLADMEENLSVLKFIKEEERERVKEKYTRFISLIKRLTSTKEEKEWAEDILRKACKKFKRWNTFS